MIRSHFSPQWLIQKKRDGTELSSEEIHTFIQGVTDGSIADYQATAFLMAVFFQGMSKEETFALTEAMLESGETYDLSMLKRPRVDKHSTGGVGDKVSLILSPLAATCGLDVPMMSGRGLGHSGGTLDKLESIPGFRTDLSKEEFIETLLRIGCAMIGQSQQVAPADKKLYALRDVTATVECIPLITGSILSKKLAEGIEAIVFDVKVGSGAFMKSLKDATILAKSLVGVAKKKGLRSRALLTSMHQPLGYAAGNAIEVVESIEVLQGRESEEFKGVSSTDLKELTLLLVGHMLEQGRVVKSLAQGRKLALEKLEDGSAWKKFRDLVQAQGGDVSYVDQPSKLARSDGHFEFRASKRGFVASMQTEELGRILVDLGGGRKRAEDPVDPGVSMIFHKKIGSPVRGGEPVVTVFAPKNRLDEPSLKLRLNKAIQISATRKAVPKLVFAQY